MDEYNTKEKQEELFKKVNGYGTFNYCFACSNIMSYSFGAIGAYLTIKKHKKVVGYLLNQTNLGIGLIPLISTSLNKNEADIDNYIFIPQNKIKEVKIKNDQINFKKITIILKDKTKYKMRTVTKILKQSFHNENLQKFMEMYK